jgi:hypothetical protein
MDHLTSPDYYRSPEGRTKSAGTYSSKRAALRAAGRLDHKVDDGSWIDRALGQITFQEYVEEVWLPSQHLELSTHQACASILNYHFIPFFGRTPMKAIMPSTVQAWVTKVSSEGKIKPVTIKKNHVMLHSVFRRAVRDRIISFNPCTETELPKVLHNQNQTLTPEEYARLYAAIPRALGLRTDLHRDRPPLGGAGRPASPAHRLPSPHGLHRGDDRRDLQAALPHRRAQRRQALPKNNKPRVIGLRQGLLDRLAARIQRMGLGRDDLLCPSTDVAGGGPISRNTFRTRIWLPAAAEAGIDFTSACTTYATPTPPGCSRAVPTWLASWSA